MDIYSTVTSIEEEMNAFNQQILATDSDWSGSNKEIFYKGYLGQLAQNTNQLIDLLIQLDTEFRMIDTYK